mmetsp:Transcript_85782/g.216043  ORF Transcript_85782/g.216043 Transcript_85782/m.216043 type:complete len:220 (-) Transcript_85782:176-835(-)
MKSSVPVESGLDCATPACCIALPAVAIPIVTMTTPKICALEYHCRVKKNCTSIPITIRMFETSTTTAGDRRANASDFRLMNKHHNATIIAWKYNGSLGLRRKIGAFGKYMTIMTTCTAKLKNNGPPGSATRNALYGTMHPKLTAIDPTATGQKDPACVPAVVLRRDARSSKQGKRCCPGGTGQSSSMKEPIPDPSKLKAGNCMRYGRPRRAERCRFKCI